MGTTSSKSMDIESFKNSSVNTTAHSIGTLSSKQSAISSQSKLSQEEIPQKQKNKTHHQKKLANHDLSSRSSENMKESQMERRKRNITDEKKNKMEDEDDFTDMVGSMTSQLKYELTIFWLEKNSNFENQIYKKAITEHQNVKNLMCFENIDVLLVEFEKLNYEVDFMITSGSEAIPLLKQLKEQQINEMSQVIIFCFDVQKYLKLVPENPVIRIVTAEFSDIEYYLDKGESRRAAKRNPSQNEFITPFENNFGTGIRKYAILLQSSGKRKTDQRKEIQNILENTPINYNPNEYQTLMSIAKSNPITIYTQESVVYKEINEAIRNMNIKSKDISRLTKKERKQFARIENIAPFAIRLQHEIYKNKKNRFTRGKLYRGLFLDIYQINCFKKALAHQKTIWFEGFTSATESKLLALTFGNTVMKIIIEDNKSTDFYPIRVKDFSPFKHEEEILFRMQSSFLPLSYKFKENIHYLNLKFVGIKPYEQERE